MSRESFVSTPLNTESVSFDALETELDAIPPEILPKELRAGWIHELEALDGAPVVQLEAFRKKLTTFLKERKKILLGEPIFLPHISEEAREALRETIERLFEITRIDSQKIGYGMCAQVFTVPTPDARRICIKRLSQKFIKEEYTDEGNLRIADEMDILVTLADIRVEGVYSPRPFAVMDGLLFKAIIMEEIRGWTMKEFVSGSTTLPEDFSVENYIRRLTAYISTLHERGIYHLDLHEGNLMLDMEHNPVVIDFGKSIYLPPSQSLREEDAKRDIYQARDMQKIAELKKMLLPLQRSHSIDK